MKVIRAKHAGFCYGVRRAARMAFELLENGFHPVFTLGPLMHNPQEVHRLSERGLLAKGRMEECVGAKTLVRTHGISRGELGLAIKLGIELIDATCPHVKVPRRKIKEFGRQGRTVFIVGDRGHPEVQALCSYALGPVKVVSKADEIPKLSCDTPIGLVAQTTQSQDFFSSVVSTVKAMYPDTVEAYTICQDAELRQEDGRRLAKRVDLVVVVGGRNSANTCRLADLCKAVQPKTIHVECVQELMDTSFGGIEKAGLVSGASTPEWIIQEVESWLTRRPHA